MTSSPHSSDSGILTCSPAGSGAMAPPQVVSAAADIHRSEELESGWSQIEHGMLAWPQLRHTVRLLAANGGHPE
jgi:hypothetical protein